MKFHFSALSSSIAIISLCSCSIGPGVRTERTVIDSAGQESSAPDWVRNTKTTWSGDNGNRIFKAFNSVRGDERVSACYTLAKLNLQEAIASEVFADFKSLTSHATQGTLEGSTDVLQQSRNVEASGLIQGLRHAEEYHQRYLVNGSERIDCYVLAEISDSDYRRLRASILSSRNPLSPDLRKAIEDKHSTVFRETPASTGSEEWPSLNQGALKLAPAPEPAIEASDLGTEEKPKLSPVTKAQEVTSEDLVRVSP